jgi:hypothetical protein
MAKRRNADDDLASSGHSLGQKVGDWLEEHFVMPLLQQVAKELKLYLDHRFRKRKARPGDKITWRDEDNNEDKARDDSGKLMPMREMYPTARFLGIIAGGDFTGPASTLVQSRRIDLFCIPKTKIISAFEKHGILIDYPDRMLEAKKAQLTEAFDLGMTPAIKPKIAKTLHTLIGEASINTYVDRVRAALGALPQELRFIMQKRSQSVVFESIHEATVFLENPIFDFEAETQNFIYEITYSDGSEFERPVTAMEELRKLHHDIDRLAQHVSSLAKK